MSQSFQTRVHAWMLECFGEKITMDRTERADRFVEEALELAQSIGWTPDRAHALVDYVFSRPVGETRQEVGGVMVTLAALCNVAEPGGIPIEFEAQREIDRITTPAMIEKIRAKQAAKPTGSALPIHVADDTPSAGSLSPDRRELYLQAIAYAVECSDGADLNDRDRRTAELGARRAIDFILLKDGGVAL